jgi:hypothetical protein
MNKTDFLFDEPSAPKPEAEKEWIGPRHLTASQAVALKRLADLARLRGQPDRGGVTLRNKPLIVGPSGSGKTALVRRLCDLEELPLLVVNAGGWLVHGCTSGPQTLSVIRRFVETNPEGCIFVDEIDKSVPGNSTFSHSWPLGVFTEILSLCDADGKLLTSGWQPEHVRRLSQSHFVVGAGTWQIHVAPKKKNDNEKDDDYIKRIAEKSGIANRLLHRDRIIAGMPKRNRHCVKQLLDLFRVIWKYQLILHISLCVCQRLLSLYIDPKRSDLVLAPVNGLPTLSEAVKNNSSVEFCVRVVDTQPVGSRRHEGKLT